MSRLVQIGHGLIVACEPCEGTGEVGCGSCRATGLGSFAEDECTACEGRSTHPCEACRGTGERDLSSLIVAALVCRGCGEHVEAERAGLVEAWLLEHASCRAA